MSEINNKQSGENPLREPPSQEQINSSIKYFAEFIVDSFLEMHGEKYPNKERDDLLMNFDKKPRKRKK